MINEEHRSMDEYEAYLQTVFAEFQSLWNAHKDRLDEIRKEENMPPLQGEKI